MANIAAVFHWPLSELGAMSLPELLTWNALAIDRWNAMNCAE
ncbi:GpE family phage tail protein [Novosphingobium huizhouense]|nr:GpE family phage tail protein [Novosphingobium huizhouense]